MIRKGPAGLLPCRARKQADEGEGCSNYKKKTPKADKHTHTHRNTCMWNSQWKCSGGHWSSLNGKRQLHRCGAMLEANLASLLRRNSIPRLHLLWEEAAILTASTLSKWLCTKLLNCFALWLLISFLQMISCLCQSDIRPTCLTAFLSAFILKRSCNR